MVACLAWTIEPQTSLWIWTHIIMNSDTSFWLSLLRTIILCRDATQLVVEKSDQLVEYLLQEGSSVPQNMDKLLLKESMDVIGKLCFCIAHNSWTACSSQSSVKKSCNCLASLVSKRKSTSDWNIWEPKAAFDSLSKNWQHKSAATKYVCGQNAKPQASRVRVDSNTVIVLRPFF